MKIHWVAIVFLEIALLGAVPAYAQSGPDDLWEVSSRVTIDGMQMPAMPSRVCVRKGQQADKLVPAGEECRITNHKTAGNRTTFRIECIGKDPMTGAGEMTTGSGSYRGSLDLSGKVDGEPARMLTEFSGKRIGSCTAK